MNLEDIYATSWEKGVPNVGGGDDESNLTLIVRATLDCQNANTLTLLRRKITLYLSKTQNTEKLEKACRSLVGCKVQFKDGKAFVSLRQLQAIVQTHQKYLYGYAKGDVHFHCLSIRAFQEYSVLFEKNDTLTLESAIQCYLTFESRACFREGLEQNLGSDLEASAIALYFHYLRHDPAFKDVIHEKIVSLSTQGYREFLNCIDLNSLESVLYRGLTFNDVYLLAELAKDHPSAIILADGEFYPLVQGKRRIELYCGSNTLPDHCKRLSAANPDLAELTIHNARGDQISHLVTPSIKKLTLDNCLLSLADWQHLVETLENVELTVTDIVLFQTHLCCLCPRLKSLTLCPRPPSDFDLKLPLPFESLSLMTQIPSYHFALQPNVKKLALDPESYRMTFYKILPFFPRLQEFVFVSPSLSTLTLDDRFFERLHKGAPQIQKLTLNNHRWGKLSRTHTRFLHLTQLDLSLTLFFSCHSEELLNSLSSLFPNLQEIFYKKEDALHNEAHIDRLNERFLHLKFTEKELG